MNCEPLQLFYHAKERAIFIAIAFTLFFIHGSYYWFSYQQFKSEELYSGIGEVLAIYSKTEHTIIKVNAPSATFFTRLSPDQSFERFDRIHFTLVTTKVDFIDYIKGFYSHSFNLYLSNLQPKTVKKTLWKQIESVHQDRSIAELFGALFLALPLGKEMRDQASVYGVSHLIAISGFHLSIIVGVLYTLGGFLYRPIHRHYFPYRNQRQDLLIVSLALVISYLIFIDMVASFLRAVVMFALSLYWVRSNMKLLSFETLFITVVIIVVLFPSYLFSLSLWLSVCAVFYIFLFLHYTEHLCKGVRALWFNLWIFGVMNPFVHYFFPITSLAQLLSPLLTVLFVLFYPLTLFLHLIGMGDSLNGILSYGVSLKFHTYDYTTPLWFFIGFMILSFAAVKLKWAFKLLIILMILFNGYLYLQTLYYSFLPYPNALVTKGE